MVLAQVARGAGSPDSSAALVVAIGSACISLTSLVWNLVLFRLSGARLEVRLLPAVLTSRGDILRGPDRGWRNNPPPDELSLRFDEGYVDLAIIRVTNVGRAAVSVSDIVLDFGRSNWRRRSRDTVGGRPIVVHECKEFAGDIRLEAGQGIAIALDHEPLIRFVVSRTSRRSVALRGSARAAGRRPTRSSRWHRWKVSGDHEIYFPRDETAEQKAFVEVFRAVYPYDIERVYEAWIAVTSLLLRDSTAGQKEIAAELAQVVNIDGPPSLTFFAASSRIAQLLPTEIKLGAVTFRRGLLSDGTSLP